MTAISSHLIKEEEDVIPERIQSSSSSLRRMARRRLSMLMVRVRRRQRKRRRHVLTDGKEVPIKGKTSDGISSRPRERLGNHSCRLSH